MERRNQRNAGRHSCRRLSPPAASHKSTLKERHPDSPFTAVPLRPTVSPSSLSSSQGAFCLTLALCICQRFDARLRKLPEGTIRNVAGHSDRLQRDPHHPHPSPPGLFRDFPQVTPSRSCLRLARLQGRTPANFHLRAEKKCRQASRLGPVRCWKVVRIWCPMPGSDGGVSCIGPQLRQWSQCPSLSRRLQGSTIFNKLVQLLHINALMRTINRQHGGARLEAWLGLCTWRWFSRCKRRWM